MKEENLVSLVSVFYQKYLLERDGSVGDRGSALSLSLKQNIVQHACFGGAGCAKNLKKLWPVEVAHSVSSKLYCSNQFAFGFMHL